MDEFLDEMDDEQVDDLLQPEEGEDKAPQLYEHFRFVADRGQSLLRVDKFLVDRMFGATRNRIQSAADAGCIMANGKPVKSNYRVKPEDVVTIMMTRPPRTFEILPENIPIKIVYEDDDLLVVDKPAGLVVHPGHGNYTGTLVNALAWYLKDDPTYDPNDPALGLVHRIDKDTSGLLVVAKKPEAKAHLSMQFFHKTTKREYRALVWGIVREDEGGKDGGHPLFCFGTSRLRHAGEMPSRNRTYASDTCPHEIYRAYAIQRRTLWRKRDPERNNLF